MALWVSAGLCCSILWGSFLPNQGGLGGGLALCWVSRHCLPQGRRVQAVPVPAGSYPAFAPAGRQQGRHRAALLLPVRRAPGPLLLLQQEGMKSPPCSQVVSLGSGFAGSKVGQVCRREEGAARKLNLSGKLFHRPDEIQGQRSESVKHTQTPFILKDKKCHCTHTMSPTAVCMGEWEHPGAQSSFPDLQTLNHPFEPQNELPVPCTCRNASGST